MEVVGGVKSILFGDEADYVPGGRATARQFRTGISQSTRKLSRKSPGDRHEKLSSHRRLRSLANHFPRTVAYRPVRPAPRRLAWARLPRIWMQQSDKVQRTLTDGCAAEFDRYLRRPAAHRRRRSQARKQTHIQRVPGLVN